MVLNDYNFIAYKLENNTRLSDAYSQLERSYTDLEIDDLSLYLVNARGESKFFFFLKFPK